jgi:GNAT superfamily N-acetyltransferase
LAPIHSFTLRPATANDAYAAAALLRRSITELCATDHQHDEATLTQWLANKTPERFMQWLANTDNYCIIAEENEALLGVAAIARNGHINLLYLLPGAQGRGIGKALYLALEAQTNRWDLRKLITHSNTDACTFYQRMGFQPTGPAAPFFGKARSWPFEKAL